MASPDVVTALLTADNRDGCQRHTTESIQCTTQWIHFFLNSN